MEFSSKHSLAAADDGDGVLRSRRWRAVRRAVCGGQRRRRDSERTGGATEAAAERTRREAPSVRREEARDGGEGGRGAGGGAVARAPHCALRSRESHAARGTERAARVRAVRREPQAYVAAREHTRRPDAAGATMC